jgi:hypothetical protein
MFINVRVRRIVPGWIQAFKLGGGGGALKKLRRVEGGA